MPIFIAGRNSTYATTFASTGQGGGGEGGSEALLAPITTTQNAGSATSNELIVFGLGITAGMVSASGTLSLYDDDGSGGQGARLANFQFNNAAIVSGQTRWIRCAAIVPSYTQGQTRVLRAKAATCAQPTGSTITAADILALGGLASGGIVIDQSISGATWSASLEEALQGSTSFVKTTACDHGDWSSGTAMFERTYSTPFRNAGVAHVSGDGLRAEFDVRAWKAGVGAVSGGNPILGVFTRCRVRNGHRTAGSELVVTSGSISRATSLTDPTLINSTAQDIDGNQIIYRFQTPWKHWVNSEWVWDAWIGPRQNVLAVLGDLTTTGGTAVTPVGQEMFNHWRDVGYFPKYRVTAAAVTHTGDLANLNLTSRSIPLQRGTAAGLMGNIQLAEGGTGERADQRIVPDWYVRALLKYDGSGRRIIFENSKYVSSVRLTGHGMKYSSTTERYYKAGDTYPNPVANSPSDPWSLDSSHEVEKGYTAYLLTGDYQYFHSLNARVGELDGTPLYDGAGTNFTVFGDVSQGGELITGSGYTDAFREDLTDWSSNQMRGAAWQFRSIFQLGFLCPDRFTSHTQLGWSGGWARTFVANHLTRAANVIDENTGAGSLYNRYATDKGQRYTHTGAEGGMFAPWMLGYLTQSLGLCKRMGNPDPNLQTFLEWIGGWYIGNFNDPEFCPDYGYDGYWEPIFRLGEVESSASRGRLPFQHYDIQARTVTNAGAGSPGGSPGDNTRWTPPGTITVNKVSGADVVVTIPTSTFSQSTTSQAYYVDKYIGVDSCGGSRAQILSVNFGASPQTMTVSTIGSAGLPFPGTSFAQFDWHMPRPHRNDYAGNGQRPITGAGRGSPEPNYIDQARAATVFLDYCGVSGALPVYNYFRSWKVSAENIGVDIVP